MIEQPRGVGQDANYKMHGYVVNVDYKMYEATHPQERSMWNMAVAAYDHIEATDVEQCLADMEDE